MATVDGAWNELFERMGFVPEGEAAEKIEKVQRAWNRAGFTGAISEQMVVLVIGLFGEEKPKAAGPWDDVPVGTIVKHTNANGRVSFGKYIGRSPTLGPSYGVITDVDGMDGADCVWHRGDCVVEVAEMLAIAATDGGRAVVAEAAKSQSPEVAGKEKQELDGDEFRSETGVNKMAYRRVTLDTPVYSSVKWDDEEGVTKTGFLRRVEGPLAIVGEQKVGSPNITLQATDVLVKV